MFQVTEKASEAIKQQLKDIEGTNSVRILLSGGCGGPSLGMALDEKQENDQVFSENGLTFLIDKALLGDAQPISVDFVETPMGAGFRLTSSLKQKGGCGGSCSCS